MGNGEERVKGGLEELGGSIKKNVGSAIGNEQMEAEGAATELKGQARQEGAKAAERGQGALEELGGKIKGGVGDAIGNEQMEAEGKATELKGEARQKANE